MAIQEQVTVELAAVDVNDAYRVELKQAKKLVDYSPEQAEQLAAELMGHAQDARQMLEDHLRDVAERARQTSPLQVGAEVVL